MTRIYVCDCGVEYTPNPKFKDDKVKCDKCIKKTKASDIKLKAVSYLGGRCKDCNRRGPTVIFDFDHIEPHTKNFKISGKAIYRWEELKTELDKCELRCSNCHRLRHYTLDQIKKHKKK